jgi:phosphoserine phosphatase
MAKKFLFCDVDATLIRVESMGSFHDYWFNFWLPSKRAGQKIDYEDITTIMHTLTRLGASPKELSQRYYDYFSQKQATDIRVCAEDWFAHVSKNKAKFWIKESYNELRRLRSMGVEPVLVSSSLSEIMAPIARSLDIQHVLPARLLRPGERLQHRPLSSEIHNDAKAIAIMFFLEEQCVSETDCYAMGNNISDIPMLELVGHPIAMIGAPALAIQARRRGWRTIRLSRPTTN